MEGSPPVQAQQCPQLAWCMHGGGTPSLVWCGTYSLPCVSVVTFPQSPQRTCSLTQHSLCCALPHTPKMTLVSGPSPPLPHCCELSQLSVGNCVVFAS